MKFTELKERKMRGSPDFPMAYYFVDENHPQYVMPLHWHREFEIIRVKTGSLRLFLGNMEYVLTKGDAIFVGPAVFHRSEPHDCIYECAVFDLNMLCRYPSGKIAEQILPIIMGNTEIMPFCPADDGVLSSTVGAFFSSLQKKEPYYQIEVLSLAAKIIYLLYSGEYIKGKPHTARTERQRETMTTLLDYIEQNLTERITLGDLSRVSGINEKYLCKFFKEYSGYTPTDYVNRTRIELACFKMTSDGKSITEAAFDSGFNELSYFSRMFRKYMGVSPREFLSQRKNK